MAWLLSSLSSSQPLPLHHFCRTVVVFAAITVTRQWTSSSSPLQLSGHRCLDPYTLVLQANAMPRGVSGVWAKILADGVANTGAVRQSEKGRKRGRERTRRQEGRSHAPREKKNQPVASLVDCPSVGIVFLFPDLTKQTNCRSPFFLIPHPPCPRPCLFCWQHKPAHSQR